MTRLTTLALSLTLATVTASSALATHPHGAWETPRYEIDQDHLYLRCGEAGLECAPAPEFTAGDWAMTMLMGDIGMGIGGSLGFGLGYALAGDCYEDPDDDSFFGNCFLHGLGEGALGASLLGTTGLAAGVTLWGNSQGHRGSYWAALGGGALGLLGTAGVVAALDDSGSTELGVAVGLLLPAFSSTLGYYLSRDTSPRPVAYASSGGLIDVGRDGVVRLAPPSITVSGDIEAPTIGITLLGGAL